MSLPKPASAGKRLVRSAPIFLLTGALAVAGCGGSSKSSSTASSSSTPATSSTPTTSSGPSAGATLSVSANPEGLLHFTTPSISAKAGSVSIAFTNMSPVSHNLTVESSAHKILGATTTFTGGTHILPLNLKAGVYKFFCTVPGHRAAGMEGTLTVQ